MKLPKKSATQLTSFARRSVHRMLGSPAVYDDVLAVVALQRKTDLDHRMTLAQNAQVAAYAFAFLVFADSTAILFDQLVLDQLPAAMVEVLDHLKERRIGRVRHIAQVLRYFV